MTGDCISMTDLERVWMKELYYRVSKEKKSQIRTAFYAACGPNYGTYKERVKKSADPLVMEAIEIFWTFLTDLETEENKAAIRNGYYKDHGISNFGELERLASSGDTPSWKALNAHWTSKGVELNKSDIQKAYYQAIINRVALHGDENAWKILDSGWYEGETNAYVSSGDSATFMLLKDYYKHDLNKSEQLATAGDLTAMIGIHSYWHREGSKQAPSQEAQTLIRTAFEAAFTKNYETLKQKVKSCDESALDAIKRVWWKCNHIHGEDSFCSIPKTDQTAIMDAYDSACGIKK
jgi:hypothetical protein